jgi:RimJ/RimL family protein N-acetyltransferase
MEEAVHRHEDIRITSDRLQLSAFTAHDADDAFACITPTLTRHMSWDPAPSQAAFREVWTKWVAPLADGSEVVFAIRERESDRFAGLAGLHRLNEAMPELGIWIREDRHGLGYGAEAVRRVAEWATQSLDIERFVYPVAERNHASRRIAEALGGVVVERRTTRKYEFIVYCIDWSRRRPGRKRSY